MENKEEYGAGVYESLQNRLFEAGFLAGQKEGYGIGYREGYEKGKEVNHDGGAVGKSR